MADLASLANQLKTIPDTTKLFEGILQGAVSLNASDIHLEPQEKFLRIRFRIDGVVQEVVSLPKESYKNLLSRIKFMTKMDLTTRDAPQEGRFGQEILGRHFDFRCATLPVADGENLVIRLLEQEAKFYTLPELGFRKETEEQIRQTAKKPSGMILTVGPTGSGKTTTLYAILNELNKPGVKIVTLEDPIEYKMEGLVQVQIEEEAGLNFAQGLKGALRSDPDIIMVGEIRDLETAETSLQASLSGHLVLSTFHSNSPAAALVRLAEIGIKPYLLSGSINLLIAQLLVRKLCSQCRETIVMDRRLFEYLKAKLPGYKIPAAGFRGRGCPECSNTGFRGRTAIAEILAPTPELEELVTKKAPLSKIIEKSQRPGFLTLEQDGLLKAIQGTTTFKEVFRVARG